MLEKLKLYNRHSNGQQQYKSFLDELERFNESSQKMEIYATPDLAFLAILKFVFKKTNKKLNFLDLKKGDEISFGNKKEGVKKWKIVEIDFETYFFVLEAEVSPTNKIWLGANFVKLKKQVAIFRYFEGYMTEKTNVGLNKILSQKKNEKNLKMKTRILENKINVGLKDGIRKKN